MFYVAVVRAQHLFAFGLGFLGVLVLLLAIPSLAGAQTVSVKSTVSVGTNPSHAAITPNGADVFVSNSGGNNVSEISTATNAVIATITVGANPGPMVLSPNGAVLYVGNTGGSISVINVATKSVTFTISTPGPVRDLAITPTGSNLYVAMEFSGLGDVATSTETLSVVSSVVCPEGVAVHGTALYVNYQCGGPGGSGGHDAVGIYSLSSTGSFIGTTGSVIGLPNVGSQIFISPNGAEVWANTGDACSNPAYNHVGCPASPGVPESALNVLSTLNNGILQSLGFSLTEADGLVSFFPDSSLAFVGGGDLKLIDTRSFRRFATLSIAASGSVVFTPKHNVAYAPIPGSNEVAVLSIAPTAFLSRTFVSFAPQTNGTTSAPQSVTLTNNSSVKLQITNIVSSGDFSQTNTCPTSLSAGASCTFSITFTPTMGSGTLLVGSITVLDNSSVLPQVITLRGTGQ